MAGGVLFWGDRGGTRGGERGGEERTGEEGEGGGRVWRGR